MLFRSDEDVDALNPEDYGPELCRLIAKVRPELDAYLVTDRSVEAIAGLDLGLCRRVFYNQEDFLELHLNVLPGVQARVCRPVDGDHVACVGENRKVLVFPLDELPEMTRGKGVRLQKYKDGGLSDARTFTLADGLSWLDPAGRTRTEADLGEWIGKRASAGRMAPRGFPRDNRFG